MALVSCVLWSCATGFAGFASVFEQMHQGRNDRFTLDYTDKELQTAVRRVEQI